MVGKKVIYMCEIKSQPTYQYSKFLGDNREEQVVIRADNWEEFREAGINIGVVVDGIAGITKKDLEKTVNSLDKPTSGQRSIKTGEAIPVTEFEKTCYKCGAEMITNPKTGKIFCKEKCWLKEAK